MTTFLPFDFFENDEYEYTDFECIVEFTFQMTDIDFDFFSDYEEEKEECDWLYNDLAKEIKSKTFTTKLKFDDYEYLKECLDNYKEFDWFLIDEIRDNAFDIIIDYIQDYHRYLTNPDWLKENKHFDIFSNTFELEVTKLEVKKFITVDKILNRINQLHYLASV